ncbi:MAG TPA: hypothetical protein VFY23_06245, partial [Candidatus Limnocylindrales bacterium]|nr:hypothetical protein [Candidatus Limnocylindrales bacterium]
MIVEPVPAAPGSRSRSRRLMRVVTVALAPVALAAFVAIGALGPRPPATPEVSSGDDAASPVARPPSTSTDGPDPGSPEGRADYPGVVETLPTRTIATLTAQAPEPGRIVAVRALLSMDAAAGCGAATPAAATTFCERTADLADRPMDFTASPANVGPYLRVTVPAGVRLPRQVLRERDGDRRQAPVVGLLAPRRDGGYRLERVAWVAGTTWRAPSIAPEAARNPFDETWWQRRLEAEATLGLQARNGSVVMLVTAYLRPPDLAAAFPDAGDASRRAGVAPGHALWFARALYPGGVGEGTPRRDE